MIAHNERNGQRSRWHGPRSRSLDLDRFPTPPPKRSIEAKTLMIHSINDPSTQDRRRLGRPRAVGFSIWIDRPSSASAAFSSITSSHRKKWAMWGLGSAAAAATGAGAGSGGRPLRPASSLGDGTMSIIPEVERTAPEPFSSSSSKPGQRCVHA